MLSAILLCLLALIPVQTERTTIYVAAPMREGFIDTDKDIQDSIKDVRGRLNQMKEFQIVDARDKAQLVLTVIKRGVGSEAYGQRVNYTEYYRSAELTSVPILTNTFWVASVLEVGTYRKEFLGSYTQELTQSLGAWGDCAKQIAEDVKVWAIANTEQLSQRRRNP